MRAAKIPSNEQLRHYQLSSYEVLDTEEELAYDKITHLAATICDCPISLISLIDSDRQWFKSHFGLDARETPRDIAFCAHVVFDQKVLVVPDARIDERFQDNPLVTNAPNVTFYLGMPLTDKDGYTLGTLCVIDSKPRQINEKQMEALYLLADHVIALLRLRKKARRLLAYENDFKKLSERIPGAIFQMKISPDGKSSFPIVDSKFEEIYDYSAEEIKIDASVIWDRLYPEDKLSFTQSLQASMNHLTDWCEEYRIVLPEKGVRWVRISSRPEKLKDGSVLWSGFMADITSEKEQDVVLKQSSKLITLGELAAGIAHEVNNPLTVIQGMTALINRLSNDPEKIRERLATIDKAVGRIAKIINGLRKFSRMSEGDRKKSVALKSIIQESLNLSGAKAAQFGVKFIQDIQSDGIILGNEIELEQTVVNLINNAIDAIKAKQEKWIEIKLFENQETVFLQVLDCGDGIPEEIRSKIFKAFFTTKPAGEGTGLGLSIISGILREHNATVEVKTDSPHTCFEIQFKKTILNLNSQKK